MNGEGFRAKLETIINEHSMESGSNTPDFILAKYLAKCLTNFDESVVARDTWYGKRATGTALVDSERTPPESRSINPISPSYEAGKVEGFTSGQNNQDADLSDASLRERALVAWNGSEGWCESGAARRLTASFGSRATAPVHFERRRDEFVEGYIYGFTRGARGGDGGGGGAGGNAYGGGVGGNGQPLGHAGGAGGAGGNAGRISGALEIQVAPLRDDKERDWRTFAFAKTGEGSVWERASVQRLFATIDHHRRKWREYENEYILPCFRWARELGFDLERMVIDNPGHNCVELLVSTLRKCIPVHTLTELREKGLR